jgi:hypothetical protein
MEHFNTALRYSEWALEMLILPPLCVIFVLSAASLVWAAIKQRPFKTRFWKPHHWLVASHVMFFGAAIAVGVFGANPIANPTIPHPPIPAAERALAIVTYGSVASCGFWIWQMKGFRWFAASLLILAEVITWGAFIVAGMSVSGDWL